MDLQPNKIDGIFLPITNKRISASEWNQLVGSCMAFITEAGLTPDASDNEQFLNAFKKIAAGLELVGANTNLSNLTATGEARFTTKANTDLANVTNTGKSTAAGWAMPSGTHVNLTLGASGSTYTAPADGWFNVDFIATNANGFIALYGTTAISATANSGRYGLAVSLAVKKNTVISILYGNGSAESFKFIYAVGSESEAN